MTAAPRYSSATQESALAVLAQASQHHIEAIEATENVLFHPSVTPSRSLHLIYLELMPKL